MKLTMDGSKNLSRGPTNTKGGEYISVFFLLDDLSEHIYTGGERGREGGEMFK